MKTYIVLYRIESIMSPLDDPFGFRCMADNMEHAEEQCLDAEPECDIVGVIQTDEYKKALTNWLEN